MSGILSRIDKQAVVWPCGAEKACDRKRLRYAHGVEPPEEPPGERARPVAVRICLMGGCADLEAVVASGGSLVVWEWESSWWYGGLRRSCLTLSP